ncbi:MAG TPA: DUF4446 family protein [Candidatus Paceibacterota bacterium]|nr:DUF4446 family protein [Candidatus Paceibacterota bacterium]HRZ34583.1 DUF4446 family protein [Candidatus Paceibacterota bacterium]
MVNFFKLEIIVYIISVLSIVCLILIAWNIRLEIKNRRLLRGKNAKSLEDTIMTIQKDLDKFAVFRKEIEAYLTNIEKRLGTCIRGVQNISFNAFQGLDSGGRSFASAFLDEKGDGVIISSLHARERVSIFAKQIKRYKSEVELSEEEKMALTKARESCSV